MSSATGAAKRRALLIGFAIAFGVLLTSETALRLFGFDKQQSQAPMLVWNPLEDALMTAGTSIFQFDDHTLWSPSPGHVIQFEGVARIDGEPEYVNADGFRGPRVPLEKTPGVVRIATLGDSSTFGFGVRYEDTYTAQLAVELERRGARAEVIDGGVVGYSIRQGLERYRQDVRPWRPDVVIAAFGAVNEHWSDEETDDDQLRRLARARTWGSRAKKWLNENVRTVQALTWLADPDAAQRTLREAEKKRAIQHFLGRHAGQTQWPFDRRVPVDDYKSFIAELDREVRADGGRLIVIAMPRRKSAEDDFPVLRVYTRATAQAAADQNLQILFAHARFRHAEKNGEPGTPWFIEDWWHPSPLGHRKLAEWLAPMVLDAELNAGRDLGVDELR